MNPNQYFARMPKARFFQSGEVYFAVEKEPMEIYLVFNGERWVETTEEDFNNGTKRELTMWEFLKRFDDCSPADAFAAVRAGRDSDAVRRYDTAALLTERKVIGWAYRPFGRMDHSLQIDEDEIGALINDFRTHGYFFSAEEYMDGDYEPIFDDYRYHAVSEGTFASLMATANYGQPIDFLKESAIEFERRVMPRCGLYKEFAPAPSIINPPKEFFDQVGEFLGKNTEEDNIYLLPVLPPKDQFYFPEQVLKVVSLDGEQTWDVVVHGIMNARSKEDFISILRGHKLEMELENESGLLQVHFYSHVPSFSMNQPFLVLRILVSGEDRNV